MALLSGIMCLVGCRVHEFPEDTKSSIESEVSVTLSINLSVDAFVEFDRILMTRNSSEWHQRRFMIEVYSDDDKSNTPIQQVVAYKDLNDSTAIKTTLSLLPSKYKIAVWQDYVNQNGVNPYYEIPSFSAIHIPSVEYYRGDTEEKMCASLNMDVDLTHYQGQNSYHVELHDTLRSPLARIEFITTDIDKYISRMTKSKKSLDTRTQVQSLTAKIVYPAYLPSGFNVLTNKPNDSSLGYSCHTKVQPTSSNEARIGFDYILINSHESFVDAQLVIFDENTQEVSRSGTIHIPIKRGATTYIYDEFLTKQSNSGVTINHKFDGEFNIYI